MGVGGGSGGGGFKLEKTWRSTGVGTQTFNSPGNFTFPYGKYSIDISGRAQPGNYTTPGNISSYNPRIPGNIASYNPQVPSNIAAYNTIVPGNATGVYNAPAGGNLSGYTQLGGNIAGYNPGNPPSTTYTVFASQYISAVGSPAIPGNATGAYNPPSGGNASGNYNPTSGGNATGAYNPPSGGNATGTYNAPSGGTLSGYQQVGGNISNYNAAIPAGSGVNVYSYIYQTFSGIYTPGNQTNSYNPPSGGNISGYNPLTPGNAASYNPPTTGSPYTVYTNYYCAPWGGAPGAISVYETRYNPFYAQANYYYYTRVGTLSDCPSPYTYAAPGEFVYGNIATYNPPGVGVNYNPIVPGTRVYNPPYYVAPEPGGLDGAVINEGSQPTCPAPYSYYDSGFNPSSGYFYETVNYTCSPYTIPATPSTANYNAISYIAVYNPVIPSSQNYNPIISGNQNYNPIIVGNQNYNPIISGSAVYNTPIPAGANFTSFYGPYYLGVFNSVPAPVTNSAFQYLSEDQYGSSIFVQNSTVTKYMQFAGNASTTPGNPGTATYNTISYAAVYNPITPGSQNYNSPTGGTPNYNVAVNSNANYNSPTGQNAVYNSPIPGTSGNAMTVLGVYFPGGLPNQPQAPLISSTINTYAFPDESTQPISLAPGGYVNITVK